MGCGSSNLQTVQDSVEENHNTKQKTLNHGRTGTDRENKDATLAKSDSQNEGEVVEKAGTNPEGGKVCADSNLEANQDTTDVNKKEKKPSSLEVHSDPVPTGLSAFIVISKLSTQAVNEGATPQTLDSDLHESRDDSGLRKERGSDEEVDKCDSTETNFTNTKKASGNAKIKNNGEELESSVRNDRSSDCINDSVDQSPTDDTPISAGSETAVEHGGVSCIQTGDLAGSKVVCKESSLPPSTEATCQSSTPNYEKQQVLDNEVKDMAADTSYGADENQQAFEDGGGVVLKNTIKEDLLMQKKAVGESRNAVQSDIFVSKIQERCQDGNEKSVEGILERRGEETVRSPEETRAGNESTHCADESCESASVESNSRAKMLEYQEKEVTEADETFKESSTATDVANRDTGSLHAFNNSVEDFVASIIKQSKQLVSVQGRKDNSSSALSCCVQGNDRADTNLSSNEGSNAVSCLKDALSSHVEALKDLPCEVSGIETLESQAANHNESLNSTEKSSNEGAASTRDAEADDRLTSALRFSCKLSPGIPLKELDVRGVGSVHVMRALSPGGVTLVELFRKLVNLTELDLSGNLLGPQGFRVICLALSRNSTVKTLNLANNLADTDSSECLGLMLSTNNSLVKLDVSGNSLGRDYFSRCVGPALMTNKSLKVLKFSSCGSSDLSAICDALSACQGKSILEELDASNNHVGAEFGEGLLRMLKTPGCCVRHLDVHGTNLQKEGMAALLTGLQENKSLVSLNAGGHEVHSLSFLMTFLYSCICHPALEKLTLGNTVVHERDEWKPQDTMVVTHNSSLTKLQLPGCSLTDEAFRTLSEISRGRLVHLAQLDLSGNEQLTTECLSSICAMMSTSVGGSCPLSVLDFSLNAAEGLASDIENQLGLRSLKTLLLKKSRITPASIVDFSKFITMTTGFCISSLTLDGIKLSGTDALQGMLGLSDKFVPTMPCSIVCLSLSACSLNDKDVKPLMSAFGNGLGIKDLKLSANRLTDTSVNYLVDSLGSSCSLQTLDLSINKIRNAGAEKLAGALSDKLANLKSLSLADNCVGRAGILALLAKVGPSRQLVTLNLKSQQQALGDEDMDQVMEQLANSLGFDPEGHGACPRVLFDLPPTFTVNLSGLGGEPGELGPRLDSLAIQTDYCSRHRRTLTLSDAIQLSAVLCCSEHAEVQMTSTDWNRVISADKDAPTWLQIASRRQCAIYVSNLPLSVTVEKLEALLDGEAECIVKEVYLIKDQIVRKPVGLAWVLFTDTESVQRALDYYHSGQAVMYGAPFVISSVSVNVVADGGADEHAETRARQELIQRAEDRKTDETAHAQLIQSNFDESLARHEYAAQHPAYADGRVW